MESYPFKLSAQMPSITLPAQGDLFVYESGEASPRANLLGYSEQFDAAGWMKSSVTVLANAFAAPDGTVFADKLTGTAAGWWTRQANVPVVSGAEYTGSVWLRATVPGPVTLYFVDGGGVTSIACDVTADWQRFRLTYRAGPSAVLANFQIGAAENGREIFAFGAMVERGPNCTPYIPSVGPGVAYGPGEGRIRVKPDSGGEIVLRPGQRYRTAERTTAWSIRPFGQEPIEGALIIGEGDFDDANTKNSVKLDATFANVVTVANDTNSRVPVALDPNQFLQSLAPIMAYNSSLNVSLVSSTVTQIIAPGANLNGIVIEQLIVSNGTPVIVQAKTSAPVGPTEGDVLTMGPVPANVRIKVPAGKGLWAYASGNAAVVYMLYTVL